MDRIVTMSTNSSMSAELHRSVYEESRYKWLEWQASRKPQITLETTPVEYTQYMVQRYMSDIDRDVYRQRKSLYSTAAINVEQVMERWGGRFYANTGLSYLGTFGDINDKQYATIPVQVGYRQDLFGYNPYRWARQTEPLKLTVAEQQKNYDTEQTAEEAVKRFFMLAAAQEQLQMAKENMQSCDTIYAIASRRFQVASISKAELSILELQLANARNTLTLAQLEHQRATKELATWIGLDPTAQLQLLVPQVLPTIHVSADDAIAKAEENNPHYLSSQLSILEAEREAAQLKQQKGLNASIDASVGLNQVADRFADAYRHLLSQDMATVTLSIPLKDWGKRRNAYLAAQSLVEAAERAEQERARDTELDVALTVADFNERQAIVETARQALTIAEDAYAQTLQRFIRAQADAYSLSVAQSHWQTARQNQIASLQNYWLAYYHLRRLTLYDYQRHQTIAHNK
jgi:outer membrane protein TolC